MSYFRPTAYEQINADIDKMIQEVRRLDRPMATRLSDSGVMVRATPTFSERFQRYWERVRNKWSF
jgi:hypothetical protein